MKNSEGLKKVSINAGSSEIHFFKALARDILHGREMIIEPGLSIFTLPDGTIFEFYGVGSHFPEYLFSHNKIVNSYQVTDLPSALEQLEKHGAILLGKIVYMSPSCCYCHVRLGDDTVLGLFQYNAELV
jgi:hypothetical protein